MVVTFSTTKDSDQEQYKFPEGIPPYEGATFLATESIRLAMNELQKDLQLIITSILKTPTSSECIKLLFGMAFELCRKI